MIAPVDEEIIVDGLRDMLASDEFLDVLAEVWSKRPTNVPFVAPEQIAVDEIATPDRYPVCELVMINNRRGDVGAQNKTGRRTIEVSLQWSIAGSDEEIMSRQLKRYMTASLAFLDQRSLRPYCVALPIVCGDIDYGTLAGLQNPKDGGKYSKSAGLTLLIEFFA